MKIYNNIKNKWAKTTNNRDLVSKKDFEKSWKLNTSKEKVFQMAKSNQVLFKKIPENNTSFIRHLVRKKRVESKILIIWLKE